MPAPVPLDAVRHLEAAFGVAICLSGKKSDNSIAELELELDFSEKLECTTCEDKALETLRQGNPAARALPLLQILAGKHNARVVIPHVQSTALTINVTHN